MPEPIALEVVVGDLDDLLRAERLPGQVLAAVPAAGRTGQALARLLGRLRPFRPFAPRMTLDRVLAERLEARDERRRACPR